jgi:hypothetical protein
MTRDRRRGDPRYEVGTPVWARTTLRYAGLVWQYRQHSHERWLRAVNELRAGRAWKRLGYPDLHALLRQQLGATVDERELDEQVVRDQHTRRTLR